MRIFIDCFLVDFSRQPTGIPRVVLKYIEAGYEWGESNGADVVPVVTTDNGIFPVRPLPGEAPPESTKAYLAPRLIRDVSGSAAASHLREAESSLRAALIEAGAPSSVAGVEAGMSSLFAKLITGGDADGLEIDLRPGDVIFYPAYWHDIRPKLLKQAKAKGARLFVLVHDILPITFSKFYHSPWREHFADNLLAAVCEADGIFAVSQYTADGVLEFARANGVPLAHVEVFHNGFDALVEDEELSEKIENGTYRSPFAKRERHDFFRQQQPYLMVGTIEPKKGHVPVIQSFEALWRNGLDRNLVLVGRRGWLDEQVVNRIQKSEFFGNKLFWFDDLDDVDLYIAYRESRALIFSSFAEGFGIPMVEAAMSGLPMICYDTAVAREVSGRFALYYSSFPELESHIQAMEADDTHRRQKELLKDFSWPSWQETGFRLFEYLKSQTSP